MTSPQSLSERMLQAAATKAVSKELGTLAQEFAAFTKNMSEDDVKASKLMILGMMRNACDAFCRKMEARIESKSQSE